MTTHDISSWIASNAKRSPNKVAIRFEERETTYAEFENRIARLSGVLAGPLGLNEGDRVSFLGDNCPEILELLFTCARTGAIFVPLNARMTTEQLRVFIRSSQPRCLFVDAKYVKA